MRFPRCLAAWSFILWGLRVGLGGGGVCEPSEIMCRTLGVCDVGMWCAGKSALRLYCIPKQVTGPQRVKNYCTTNSFYTKIKRHCLNLQA